MHNMVDINKNNNLFFFLHFFLKSYVVVVYAATHQTKIYKYSQTYSSHLSYNTLVVEKHLTLKDMQKAMGAQSFLSTESIFGT
jgi:hypothetical protein